MKEDPLQTLNKIAQIIYNKKGFNIFALDLRGISSITDFIIIAEGNIARHLISICNEITVELKEEKITPIHVEGLSSGEWIVIDYGWINVHLLLPEYRLKYRLENLWQEAKIIDLAIDVSQSQKI